MAREKKYYNLDKPEDRIEENISSKNEYNKMVEIPTELESNGPETKNGTVINSLFVNVRKEASFEADVLEIVGLGDKVTILDKVGNFYKVSTKKNSVAYIASNFIKEE